VFKTDGEASMRKKERRRREERQIGAKRDWKRM
jgi:hypothetical protein